MSADNNLIVDGYIVMRRGASDAKIVELLKQQPPNTLIIGGPFENAGLYFYWKSENGTSYRKILLGDVFP